MSRRLLAIMVVVGMWVGVTARWMLAEQSTAPGEGRQSSTSDGRALETPWGEPDLEGIWTSETDVPLERPAKYAGREFLADTEMAELDRVRLDSMKVGERAKRGSEQDISVPMIVSYSDR